MVTTASAKDDSVAREARRYAFMTTVEEGELRLEEVKMVAVA
jgi:hypothetical protein